MVYLLVMPLTYPNNTKEGRNEGATATGERLTLIAYNAVRWIPVELPILGMMSYQLGFVVFLTITVVRALINTYRLRCPSEIGQAWQPQLRAE